MAFPTTGILQPVNFIVAFLTQWDYLQLVIFFISLIMVIILSLFITNYALAIRQFFKFSNSNSIFNRIVCHFSNFTGRRKKSSAITRWNNFIMFFAKSFISKRYFKAKFRRCSVFVFHPLVFIFSAMVSFSISYLRKILDFFALFSLGILSNCQSDTHFTSGRKTVLTTGLLKEITYWLRCFFQRTFGISTDFSLHSYLHNISIANNIKIVKDYL
jgi:hypothetical protein